MVCREISNELDVAQREGLAYNRSGDKGWNWVEVQKLVGGKSRKRRAKLKQLGQRVWTCT